MNRADENCEHMLLERFIDYELGFAEETELEQHLNECDVCCRRLNQLTASQAQWLDVASQLKADANEANAHDTREFLSFVPSEMLAPSDDPRMLGRLGEYEILGVIGAGGMGVVLKGLDRALSRYVAIKVLLPEYASNVSARRRFAREARAAASIVHENVIEIYGVSNDVTSELQRSHDLDSVSYETSSKLRRLPFLVMPYVRGESLQKRLDRVGAIPIADVLRISIQIAVGLQAAHEQGVIHRDVKPANILLSDDVARVTITDFGLARSIDDASLTRTGLIAGTPQFMSPEQALGSNVTPQSDLFSLGSVMYAMCTGRAPFRAGSSLAVARKIVDEKPQPIREINPDIPRWLCELIEGLHVKRPDTRRQGAKEIAKTLKEFLAHHQQPDFSPLPIEFSEKKIALSPKTRSNFTSSLFIGAIAMFTVSAFFIGSLLWWLPGSPTLMPTDNASAASSTNGQDHQQSSTYSKEFVVPLVELESNTLVVDIKRGSIQVDGYDGTDIVVKLSVPNYESDQSSSGDTLREIRPNNLDFQIEHEDGALKVDGNSYEYITNLEIRVPRNMNLDLDTYRDGEILVRNIEGRFEVRSHNVDIRLEEVSGSARIWSYNGGIDASFLKVNDEQPLYFESYNGSVDVTLPDDFKADVQFRSGTGRVLTNFELELNEDVVRADQNGNISFDQFVRGTINGGGSNLTVGTEQGDIRLQKQSTIR